jgi:hypothetical protein
MTDREARDAVDALDDLGAAGDGALVSGEAKGGPTMVRTGKSW